MIKTAHKKINRSTQIDNPNGTADERPTERKRRENESIIIIIIIITLYIFNVDFNVEIATMEYFFELKRIDDYKCVDIGMALYMAANVHCIHLDEYFFFFWRRRRRKRRKKMKKSKQNRF